MSFYRNSKFTCAEASNERTNNSAYAIYVRTTMLSLALILDFSYVHKFQDKHVASYFSQMTWIEIISPNANLINFSHIVNYRAKK